MDRPAFDPHLARETAKSVLGGLVGAVGSGFERLRAGDAGSVHTIDDVAVGLLPMILVNALMSTLIPAVVILWRRRHVPGGPGPLPSLPETVAIVLGLVLAGSIAAIGIVHLAAFTLSVSGLTASGILLVGVAQSVVVAVTLTPLTIILLARSPLHG